MTEILRGDIVWAELNPTEEHEQSGRRPILILSHTIFNEKSDTVIGVALTSQPQKAGFPLTLQLNQKIEKKSACNTFSEFGTHSRYSDACSQKQISRLLCWIFCRNRKPSGTCLKKTNPERL